jgi:hypothetical protein
MGCKSAWLSLYDCAVFSGYSGFSGCSVCSVICISVRTVCVEAALITTLDQADLADRNGKMRQTSDVIYDNESLCPRSVHATVPKLLQTTPCNTKQS